MIMTTTYLQILRKTGEKKTKEESPTGFLKADPVQEPLQIRHRANHTPI